MNRKKSIFEQIRTPLMKAFVFYELKKETINKLIEEHTQGLNRLS